MTAAPVDLVSQADRRARLAAALGRLLLAEPGPDAAALVAGAAELEPLGRPDPALAADFERLLLREVPLFESVFRSDDGRRGGPVVADVVAWYHRHDFDEDGRWRVASPDHLGMELRFLAHLAATEAAAWADDRPEEACRAVEAQRDFLAAHLGQWGEVALAALARRAGGGPFAALAAAAAELLAEESARLRSAPDHPGMPAVEAEPPPRAAGPARIARWLLAPARCGAFLDAEDLARAAAAIRAPWRPSDARAQFRHVVEAAADGGDLDTLLSALRPAVERWRDRHAAEEGRREADRRVWRWWRLQAEETLRFLDRLAAPPPPAAGPLVVEVRGPSRERRAAAAALVVHGAAALDASVVVSAELPPALSAELAALAAAGAGEVLLGGPSVVAVAQPDAGEGPAREARHLGEADVVVRLVAAPGPVQVDVAGDGPLAADLRRALAALVPVGEASRSPVG